MPGTQLTGLHHSIYALVMRLLVIMNELDYLSMWSGVG